MKKLLLTLCFVPSFAFAQGYTPLYGCFLENYTTNCSEASIQCDMQPNYLDNNLYYFGTTVGKLCNAYVYSLGKFNTMLAGLRKQNKLVTRLRKACGSKCKRIK